MKSAVKPRPPVLRAVAAPDAAQSTFAPFFAVFEGIADRIADKVEQRIDQKLGDLGNREPPPLLDRRGIAAALGVGIDTIDKLRREGLPTLMVGDAPRFCITDVMTWLRERGAK